MRHKYFEHKQKFLPTNNSIYTIKVKQIVYLQLRNFKYSLKHQLYLQQTVVMR